MRLSEKSSGLKGRHIKAQGEALFAQPWVHRTGKEHLSPERALQVSIPESVTPFQGLTLVPLSKPRAAQKTLRPGLLCDGPFGPKDFFDTLRMPAAPAGDNCTIPDMASRKRTGNHWQIRR